MADQEHLRWLEEGVDAWNDRRMKSPFEPDLSGEDISSALGGYKDGDLPRISIDLKGIRFTRANLSGAALRYTDLSHARMTNADLSGANLLASKFDECLFFRAYLSGADLHLAKFPNVKFFSVDFSSANFGRAELKKAQLVSCTLDDAHLYDTDITGTDFVRSRPWMARLFSPPKEEKIEVAEFTRKDIGSINDLLDGCRELKSNYGERVVPYFRGESLDTWELRPSIMRTSKRKYPFRAVEADMLT